MPAPRDRNHSARNVVGLFCRTPWAILPEKYAQMEEVIRLRSDGLRLTETEIRMRLGLDEEQERQEQQRVVNGVGVLRLFGVIGPRMNMMLRFSGGTSTQQFGKQLAALAANDQAKAILIEVDSPGGSVLGLEELALQIQSVAQNAGKPIKAVARGMCASAAYYVASAVGPKNLIATPSSMIGSIGTILVHSEGSRYWDRAGWTDTVISAGKHKKDGNAYEPLSDQARATLTEHLNQYYDQFTAAVARHRNVSVQTVLESYGQGKTFIAGRALELGMIDRVADFDAVLEELAGGASTQAVSPGGPVQQTADSPVSQIDPQPVSPKESVVKKKILAAMYALGILDSQEPDEATYNAALNAWFAARGQSKPETEEAILAALQSGATSPPAANQTTASGENTPAETGGSAGTTATQNVDLQAERQAAATAERQRIADLHARAELFGLTARDAQAAVEADWSVPEALEQWTERLANREPPAARSGSAAGGDIRASRSEHDKFTQAAAAVLFNRCTPDPEQHDEVSDEARDLEQMSLSQMARHQCRLHGLRFDEYSDRETVALEFLQLGGSHASVLSAGPAYSRPGDYPHLLSSLTGKLLDQALQLADVTYTKWTAKLSDAPDLKAREIIAIGHFDELSLLEDDQDPAKLHADEELGGWIQVDRYGGVAGLTPVMVANDDLDGFSQQLSSMAYAHENTLNRLCVNLLIGNVTCVDSNALYDDTNHGNDIASGSGGAPSVSEMGDMRTKHRAQTGVGDKGKIKTPPKVLLVPAALETTAEQVFLPLAILPVTDATTNPFRGKIQVVVEPELDDNSTTIWYTFADPRVRRAIAHCFMRGYGKGGKRTTWFDPGRKTRYYDLEGRFAAAVASYRGTCRNAGA